MKGRIIALVLVSLTVAALFGIPAVARAEGPDIGRCMEYLYPYTPVEWNRCIGDEFGKFPDVSTVMRDAYIKAPVSGQWPGAQQIYLGDNAPYVNLPQTDTAGSGYVYVPPADSGNFAGPVTTNQTLTFNGSWWQTPAEQSVQAPASPNSKPDEYTIWQNYWKTGGVTDYGGWQVPGGYTVPPW
jgi:hypothetical protein